MATTPTTQEKVDYAHTGHAPQAYSGRTAANAAGFLLPHLKPGMSVVDCGCGPGSITAGLAEAVTPGRVIGFDISEAFLEKARALAEERGLTNVTFLTGDLYEPPLPDASFDAVLLSGVLCHLTDPARALQQAFRLLKPGGLIACRDAQKGGDWAGGPFCEAIDLVRDMIIVDWRADGADPMLGRRLRPLLHAAGFVDVESSAGYSAAFSAPTVTGEACLRLVQDKEFTDRAIARGLLTEERLARMPDEVQAWMESPDSAVGVAECTALGRKP